MKGSTLFRLLMLTNLVEILKERQGVDKALLEQKTPDVQAPITRIHQTSRARLPLLLEGREKEATLDDTQPKHT